MRRKSALAAAFALAAFLAGFFLWFRWRPLDALSLSQSVRFRLGGVRRERLGPLTALARDSCGREEDCRCIALVHGLGDSAETWEKLLLDSPDFQFPKGVRAYAVNLPGTEGSDPPPGKDGYGPRNMARSVRQALEPACPRWTVAGNSLGGWVAAWLALDWPKGVERLALLDAAGLHDPTGLTEITARTLMDPTPANLKDFNDKAYFKPRAIPESVWPQAAILIRERHSREMVLSLREDDFLEKPLGRLRTPTQILWGEADRAIPPSQGQAFRSLIRGSSLHILKRCGHLPQKECPEKVRRAVFGSL